MLGNKTIKHTHALIRAYSLTLVRMCVCVCVCVRERERERAYEKVLFFNCLADDPDDVMRL